MPANRSTKLIFDADDARQRAGGTDPVVRTGPGASLDPLTDLLGASALLETLASLCGRARQRGGVLTVVLLDLDRFHEWNEHFSPAFGDRILSRFSEVLRATVDQQIPAARYYADQFVIVLADGDETRGVELAQRCREAAQARPIAVDGQLVEIGLSAGVIESTAGCLETPHQLLQRARVALSRSKKQGGNRTLTWTQLVGMLPSPYSEATRTAEDTSHWLHRLRHHLQCTCAEAIHALVAAMEARDPYTRAHSLSVAAYAETISRRLGLRGPIVQAIRSAALLHDVGKLAVPEAILTKPGPLTPEEFESVKRHPQAAMDILGHVSFLSAEKPLILHHHERYDGKGYPSGLSGRQIPVGARVLAVADALDTMFSARTYKPAFGVDKVRDELRAASGGQFDPEVVDAALDWLEDAPTDDCPLPVCQR